MKNEILKIALPAIVSNITVPLLGLVDVAIVGHLGAAEYIGAIAVGSMIFNSIYWLFGFLRMSTSGLTAQAFGESRAGRESCGGKNSEPGAWDAGSSEISKPVSRILMQSLAMAGGIGLVILLLQWPLRELLLTLMNPSDEVRLLAQEYFNICVWGAPAVLSYFALNGWFIGMQDSKTPMKIAIIQNIFNIAASSTFVFVLGMKVEGVALGTLLSQWLAVGLAAMALRRYSVRLKFSLQTLSAACSSGGMLSVSRDIFLRTLCLMSVTFFFTSVGSWQGTLTLAVNTLLMQLFLFYSYFTDGFAYAGEALAGKYLGKALAENHPRPLRSEKLNACIRRLFLWGVGVAAVFTVVYSLLMTPILSLLTDDAAVLNAAQPYLFWIGLVPMVSIAAFIWDGVFIGTTQTRGMLITCALATAVFYGVFFLVYNLLGNHALWLAYVIFLLLRGAGQTVYRFVNH